MDKHIGIEDFGDLAAWIGGEHRVLCVSRFQGNRWLRHEARTGTLEIRGQRGLFDHWLRGERELDSCAIVGLATGLNGRAKVIVVTVRKAETEETWKLYTDEPRHGSTTTTAELELLAAEEIGLGG